MRKHWLSVSGRAASKQGRGVRSQGVRGGSLTLEPLESRAMLAANQVAVFGDYGHDSSSELAVANLVDSWNIGAIAATGDNNYLLPSEIDTAIGKYYHEYIGNYKGSYGAGASTNKFWPALGNHDYHDDPTASAYLDYFTLPGNERYYDWVLGDAHFFAINTEPQEPDSNRSTGVQAAWLKDALAASTSTYNIVYNHRPPYSSAHHGNYSNAQWPFKEWGADLVLSGHDHTYERLNVGGLTYIVSGLGGAGSSGGYPFETTVPGSQVRYNADSGALRLTITANELKGEFFSIENGGKLIDTFTIAGSVGGGGGGSTPSLSIADNSIVEGNSGSKSLLLTVNLSAASTSAVTVRYATASTASADSSDYTATSGSLSFSAGQTQKIITLTILGDTVVEGNETFAVNLSSVSGATLAKAQALVTITNDDASALPSLSIADNGRAEGSSGNNPLLFTVTLAAASTSGVTVRCATASTSSASSSDCTATSGSLSFSAGQTQKIITVNVLGDTVVEGNETFAVNLSSVSGATISRAQAIGTITNDDTAGGTPSLSIADNSRAEGSSGNNPLLFTVTLSAPSTSGVTVRYATASTSSAATGSDYAAVSGSLLFSAGQTQKVITVTVLGDTVVEPDETFAVNLSSVSGATIAKAQAIGKILNDDTSGTSARVKLFVGNASVVEGNAGQTALLFPVWLDAASQQTVSANWYLAADRATADSDYVNATGTVRLAPGQTQTTIAVQIIGDTLDERRESFDIYLIDLVNAKGGDRHAGGAILNDDSSSSVQLATPAAAVSVQSNVGATLLVSTGEAGGGTAASSSAGANGALAFADKGTSASLIANNESNVEVDVDEELLDFLALERVGA